MKSWQDAAIEHAQAKAPREACGLVVIIKGRERYWPCQNLANDDEFFILSPDDFAAAEDVGEVVALFHSHPNAAPQPSQADLVSCERSGVPWHIVNPDTLGWGYCEPSGYKAQLLGRPWVWGVTDCWSLVRDWYKEELGLELRDWQRPVSYSNFNADPMFERCWAEAGFVEIDFHDLQAGDAILMRLDSPGLNHVGVYIGDQLMLHHIQDRLSSRDLYNGYYQNNTGCVLRHSSRCQ